MEVDNETSMKCFKIPWKIVGNLRISCDITSSTVVLWTKYQLFVFKNLNFNNPKKIEPEFEIEDVIVMKDCFVFLDCSGNVNTGTFEPFTIWRENIKCICACEIMNTSYVISLQFKENRATLLANEFKVNDFPHENADLEFEMPNEDWMTPGKNSIMVCSYIKSAYSKKVKDIFNSGELESNYLMVVVSLDRRNLYAVLFPRINLHDELEVNTPNIWVKLYKSYTDIVDINIMMAVDDICITAGLAGGNIVKVPLLLRNQTPQVYHLNTAINKFIIMGNTIIYTDALTMWKNENIFSKSESELEQFMVRNIRDFCLIRNHIICVTYSNLIYSFDITHRSSYLISLDTNNSSPIQRVTNSNCLQKIIETVETNAELLKKIDKDSEHLMALSLSERQDIMDDLIQVTASVFDDYRDLALTNTDLTLTDELDAYYDRNSYYFLIHVLVNRVQHKLNKLLSDVLGDIKIHITLLEYGVLKTTSIQINQQLTTKNFVIPLKRKNKNIKKMQVCVKIITNIPGKFDENQNLWTILYRKCIDLNAENFIIMKTESKCEILKEDETSLEMLIYKGAKYLHGTDYKFHILDCQGYEWKFYVKLPDNYNLNMEDIFKLIDPVNSRKAYACLKQLVRVLNDKKLLEFKVGKEQVRLRIEYKTLIVTCRDIIIASEIRNFFSRIIFNHFKSELGRKLIEHKYYTTIENLKRDIHNSISSRISNEEFAKLLTRFLGNIYRLTPI